MKHPFGKADERYGADANAEIIGLELRLIAPNGTQREVAMFPVEIEIPHTYYGWQYNVTLHTALGDATSPNVRMPL